MPRNGSGSFTRVHDWTADADAAIDIRADRMDEDADDIAQAISDSIAKNGETTATQIIPFAQGIETDILSPVTPNGPIDLTGGQLKFPSSQNPSSDANTLDDYQEGDWTPTDTSGAGLSFSSAAGSYTKIGNMVFAYCHIVYPVTANGASADFGGLPFTVPNVNRVRHGFVSYSSTSNVAFAIPTANTTRVPLFKADGSVTLNSDISGQTIFVMLIYPAA